MEIFDKNFRFAIEGFEDEMYINSPHTAEHVSAYSKDLNAEVSLLNYNNEYIVMVCQPVGRRGYDGKIRTANVPYTTKNAIKDFDPLTFRCIALEEIAKLKEKV